jgi:hypothetical protein
MLVNLSVLQRGKIAFCTGPRPALRRIVPGADVYIQEAARMLVVVLGVT